DHVHARAPGLSLSRRHHEQPHRPAETRGSRSQFRPVRDALEEERMIAALRVLSDRLLGRGEASITVPIFDGALKPNQMLERAEVVDRFDEANDIATDGRALFVSDGGRVLRLADGAKTEAAAFDRTVT